MEATLYRKKLEALGITIKLTDSGEIEYEAPTGAVTEEVLAEMREHKAALVSLLAPAKRREKINVWPGYLRATYDKVYQYRRSYGDTHERAEETAFIVLKRPARFIQARQAGQTIAQSLAELGLKS